MTATPSASSSPELPTETPPATVSELTLAAVQPDDPDEPGLFEYVIVENHGPAAQALAGWRLVHRETSEVYTFPSLSLPTGELFVIWSGDGQDDSAGDSLYWPTTSGRWVPGQTVELYSPGGRLGSTLVVSSAGVEP